MLPVIGALWSQLESIGSGAYLLVSFWGGFGTLWKLVSLLYDEPGFLIAALFHHLLVRTIFTFNRAHMIRRVGFASALSQCSSYTPQRPAVHWDRECVEGTVKCVVGSALMISTGAYICHRSACSSRRPLEIDFEFYDLTRNLQLQLEAMSRPSCSNQIGQLSDDISETFASLQSFHSTNHSLYPCVNVPTFDSYTSSHIKVPRLLTMTGLWCRKEHVVAKKHP